MLWLALCSSPQSWADLVLTMPLAGVRNALIYTFYAAGLVLYVSKKPQSEVHGFHETFHILVVLGHRNGHSGSNPLQARYKPAIAIQARGWAVCLVRLLSVLRLLGVLRSLSVLRLLGVLTACTASSATLRSFPSARCSNESTALMTHCFDESTALMSSLPCLVLCSLMSPLLSPPRFCGQSPRWASICSRSPHPPHESQARGHGRRRHSRLRRCRWCSRRGCCCFSCCQTRGASSRRSACASRPPLEQCAVRSSGREQGVVCRLFTRALPARPQPLSAICRGLSRTVDGAEPPQSAYIVPPSRIRRGGAHAFSIASRGVDVRRARRALHLQSVSLSLAIVYG